MALDTKELEKKLKAVYKKKSRDEESVGTGLNLKPPTFFIKAPNPLFKAMGCHVPGQRIIQISGKPNSGKTTLGMLTMIEAQKGYFDVNNNYVEEPINVVLIDTEKKFSRTRFESMGGNAEDIFKIDPDTLEEAFFGIEAYLNLVFSENPNEKVLIVFDSIGGTPSKAEAGADADESIQLATAAKVIKRNLRVLVPRFLGKLDIATIFINTNYANIGSVGRSNSGGDGLEFASSFIMQLGRVKDITFDAADGTKRSKGIVTRGSITKNHLMTKEDGVKYLDWETLAYSVKDIAKFKIKKGAIFVDDESRITIDKNKAKDKMVHYTREWDNSEQSEGGDMSHEELMAILDHKDSTFEQVTEK